MKQALSRLQHVLLKPMLLSLSPLAMGDPSTATPSRYPRFSWDHVPLYMHIRKDVAYTPEELRFIARFPLITFEKANGHKSFGSVEKGTLAAARAIKKLNPHTKILYYRNVFVHYGGYEANARIEKINGAFLKSPDGNMKLIRKQLYAYDLTNPQVRSWWVESAVKVANDPAIDGIFFDGNVKVLVPGFLGHTIGMAKKKKIVDSYFNMLAQVRKELHPNKLMIANILRARFGDRALEYLQPFDGSYLECFTQNVGGVSYEDYVAKGIELVQQATRQGKIIAFTSGFHTQQQARNTSEQKIDEQHRRVQSAEEARQGLIYPMAMFLIMAEKYCYMRIHEGYSANRNKNWMRWFPEYDRPLGPPLGPAVRTGYRYTRRFQHATVWLDLKKRQGKIVWH